MNSRTFYYFSLLVLIVTSFFCAGQLAPSGGPPDTTPPEILSSVPTLGTLQFHDRKFSLQFSKYVDRRSLEESIFISPSLGELTFEWGATDVEIRFTDSLRSNTTYIATIGTDLHDTRNNRLARAFSLPFSTGDHIDSALISGSVVDQNPMGVMVFAYRIDSGTPDTLNPTSTKPSYLTQTGKDGLFVLPYLSFGMYRLIAVRDEFKNLIYDRQIDEFGVTNADVVVSKDHPTQTGVQFRLTSEDTTAPFLSSARAVDANHVLLRFSEPVEMPMDAEKAVSIADTLSGAFLSVLDVSPDMAAPLEMQIVTAKQESLRTYRASLTHFTDVSGNMMLASMGQGEFGGSSVTDTINPQCTIIEPRERSKDFSSGDTIHISFSEAVRKNSFERSFLCRDSLRKQVEGKFIWFGSTQVFFKPRSSLVPAMSYTISVRLDSVIDFSGNSFRDSTLVRRFETVDGRTLSSIKGQVIDEVKDAVGKIYLTATEVMNKQQKLRLQIINGVGDFMFDELPEGKYALSAFRDADSNGVFTYGNPFPFHRAERFTVFPETLTVRARWPLEGVEIHFK